MEKLSDFQLFLKSNNLKQKQVADYLGTSPQFVNQVARGLCALADDKLALLAGSEWDISMLNIPSYITDKVKPAVITFFPITKQETTDPSPIKSPVGASAIPAEIIEEIKEEVRDEVREELKQEESIAVIPIEISSQVDVDIKKYIEDNESELTKLSPSDLTGDVDGLEEVRKNSMWPTLVPGDRIFIKFLKHKTHITDGGIYYFNLKDRPTMIRRVKIEGDNLRLIALNPQFSDIVTNFNNVLRVADVKGMYRSFICDQYSEVEAVRRKKEEQIDKLLDQNQEALRIIGGLVQRR